MVTLYISLLLMSIVIKNNPVLQYLSYHTAIAVSGNVGPIQVVKDTN